MFIISSKEQCNILATSSSSSRNPLWQLSGTTDDHNNSLLQTLVLFHRDGGNESSSSSSSAAGGGGVVLKKRAYLSDQKRPFEHFKPKSLLLSTTRVVFVQLAGIASTAISDQLHQDLERERKVREGLLTPEEAEEEGENDWESFNKAVQCIQRFPHRCMNALLRFHATTLVMRWYEHMALSIFSIRTVDKLTKDPYLSAKRKYVRNDRDKVKAGKQMLSTSLYSSAIAILSDLTVQQTVLTFGYALYYYRHHLKVRATLSEKKQKKGASDGVFPSSTAAADAALSGGILLKFIFDSSSLLVSRTVAWLASSIGASLGTMIFPGLGTVAVSQMFDGLAVSIYDVEIPV